MATGEVTKGRSGSLLDSARASSWQTRIALVVTAFLLVLLLVQAVRDPAQFFSQLVIGVTNGAIIALVALGYTLVYGIIELINFAHGDVFMLGTMMSLTMLTWVPSLFGVRRASQIPEPLIPLLLIGTLLLAMVAR